VLTKFAAPLSLTVVFPLANLRGRVGVRRCVSGVVVVRSVKALSEDVVELLGDPQLALL